MVKSVVQMAHPDLTWTACGIERKSTPSFPEMWVRIAKLSHLVSSRSSGI